MDLWSVHASVFYHQAMNDVDALSKSEPVAPLFVLESPYAIKPNCIKTLHFISY